MRLIYFKKKRLKPHVDLQKVNRKIEIKKIISYIIAFQLLGQNSPYNDENTCYRQSMFQ